MELEELLAPQEGILCRTRMHPAAYAIPAFAAFLCFVLLCAAFVQSGTSQLIFLLLASACLLCSVSFFCFSLLRHVSAELLLTDRRVLSRRGVLKVELSELALEEMESPNLVRGSFGRRLGYGSLHFKSGEQPFSHAFLREPQAFQERLESAKRGMRPAEAADSTSAAQAA